MSFKSVVRLLVRNCRERRDRFVDHHPGQFIFEEDRFRGANDAGSSSDAIVTSMLSESLLSSKNKCVPQHAANERIRSACGILRALPFVRTKSLRGIVPQVRYGAPALFWQSMQ